MTLQERYGWGFEKDKKGYLCPNRARELCDGMEEDPESYPWHMKSLRKFGVGESLGP